MKRTLPWIVAPLLALAVTPALAYVGPGAGLSLLGALWGLLIAVLAALSFIILWPLRRYRRKVRAREGGAEESGSAGGESAGQQAPAERRATDEPNR